MSGCHSSLPEYCGGAGSVLLKDEPVVKKRKNISLKTEKTALYLVILNKFWYSIDVVRNALTALKTLFTLRCSLRVPLSFEPTLLPREPD